MKIKNNRVNTANRTRSKELTPYRKLKLDGKRRTNMRASTKKPDNTPVCGGGTRFAAGGGKAPGARAAQHLQRLFRLGEQPKLAGPGQRELAPSYKEGSSDDHEAAKNR